MKLVINTCFGGFSLSREATERYSEPKGLTDVVSSRGRYIRRNDPILVQIVEEMGHKSWGMCAKLEVVEIENGRWYKIDEYDGNESIEYRDIDDDWELASDDEI